MKIICMGDSITYGYGLSNLSQRWSDLTSACTGHDLVNCGVSGDTTGGMLTRCQAQVFSQKADAVIFLGGINDISILGDDKPVRANVISIFRQAQAHQLPLLLGVPLPVVPEDLGSPAWEPDRDNLRLGELCQQYAGWIRQFADVNQIPLIDFHSPFLLPDGRPDGTLFQDGLHPTAEGHRRMAEVLCRVLDALYP